MTNSTKPTHRGYNEGTIRQRPDGTWEARKDLEQGVDLSARKQTVGEFLDRWLADVVKANVRPSTYESYCGHVRLLLDTCH